MASKKAFGGLVYMIVFRIVLFRGRFRGKFSTLRN